MNKKLKRVVIIIAIVILLFISVVIIEAIVLYYTMPPVRKPAIYLYPVKDSFVNVSLKIDGKIIKDIPKYNNGWNVFVTKNGIINGKYDYLFYEAKLEKLQLPKEGWVVSYSNLENWFDTYLIKLGLNNKEARQFKEYWLNKLPKVITMRLN